MQLDGITVVDLSRLLPGPYGTQLLADMGAEILKIEPPEQGDYAREMGPTVDGTGSVFASINQGKKSVTLDLKSETGREIFLSIAAEADVVFEQFRPGVVDRLGIGYEAVRQRAPDIVYCSLSGFGQTGPDSDRVGHDLNYVALTGILDMTRRSDAEAPRVPGVPVADMTGGLAAACSVLGALLSRELGNGGEYIDIAMTDVLLSLSQNFVPPTVVGETPRPGETTLTGKYPCYDIYETADQRHVTLAALEPHFWETFCAAVGREDLLERHRSEDASVRRALRGELEGIFAGKTMTEWEAEFGDKEVMIAPVKTPEEALNDPQFQSRGMVGAGFPPRADFFAQASESRAEDRTAPQLGEHTAAVLREHGYENVQELRERNIV